ncbi:MAG: glycosyl transferase [Spartobacteria bacterium]
MADFYQHGTIATLHRLGNPDYKRLEEEMSSLAEETPLALILPCHARDLKSPVLADIVAELRGARFLSHITVGLDGGVEADFQTARLLFSTLPQKVAILWNDGPRITSLLAQMERAGLDPGPMGKGRNMRLCIGQVLAGTNAAAVAIHDCDILHYKRELLVRLCFPVLHPAMAFHVSKGFSARFSTQLNGRVMRLLVTPLLQAMEDIEGFARTLGPLQFFRYPISGEVCLHRRIAESLRFPSDWGVETGMMADVFRTAAMENICQVDIAESYDHKHQTLSESDPRGGLNKMACDVALCLLRTASAGFASLAANPFDGLKEKYLRAARGLLRSYAADARINTLLFDAELEQRTIDLFSGSIARAVQTHLANPSAPAGAVSWLQIESILPGFGAALHEAALRDAEL